LDLSIESLSNLTIVTFNDLVLDNIQQDVVLIMGKKEHKT
jgi:hypothetical protein